MPLQDNVSKSETEPSGIPVPLLSAYLISVHEQRAFNSLATVQDTFLWKWVLGIFALFVAWLRKRAQAMIFAIYIPDDRACHI